MSVGVMEDGGLIVAGTVDYQLDDVDLSDDQIIDLENKITGIMKNGVHQMVQLAKMFAPMKTGALKMSITGDADSDTWELTADVPYAAFQEYGTSTIIPRAFFG